jgi:hypothetical protein
MAMQSVSTSLRGNDLSHARCRRRLLFAGEKGPEKSQAETKDDPEMGETQIETGGGGYDDRRNIAERHRGR